MNLILVIALFIALVACQDIEFINPPPGGDAGEYSQNPTFVLGSVINIQWKAPEDKELNMVLYQDVPNAAFEYVFSKSPSPNIHDATLTLTSGENKRKLLYMERRNLQIFIKKQCFLLPNLRSRRG
jgi:hypothetical protein